MGSPTRTNPIDPAQQYHLLHSEEFMNPELRPLSSPSIGERFLNQHDHNDFISRIRKMNETFKLPSNQTLTSQGNERLDQFYTVLSDELSELEDIDFDSTGTDQQDAFVALADCLGDQVVYIFSEAQRWGIPLLDVLHVILDSQDSKLVDGKPLMAPDGSKFIKGPNYVPPEPKLKELLFPNG